ncbi:hypothetical protein MCAP1_002409 [Malassezia caprae]|uniref:Uncharacterized protein n=1 Tax=Malassezia caprae TaxID=1381934 RepID=A0AAF0E9A7_9BASI|nr:hypothetical protein MCAP1_002409 [Malassezia caprae]
MDVERLGTGVARAPLAAAHTLETDERPVLFDAAALSWRECLAWVAWVEEHRLPVMLVLFEPARHVFLVNIHALDSLRHHPPVFVDPARAAQALDVPASALAALALLEDAAHRSQRSVLLRSDAPHARLCGVALCGWLLGYPVVYAVTQKPAIFTTHAPGLCDGRAWDADAWSDDDARPAGAMSLLLVEATVHTELPGALPTCGLPMMSFSIPTALPHAVHVAHAWQHRLEATWDERPMRLPFLEHATCEVRMSHVHQDHIVL